MSCTVLESPVFDYSVLQNTGIVNENLLVTQLQYMTKRFEGFVWFTLRKTRVIWINPLCDCPSYLSPYDKQPCLY